MIFKEWFKWIYNARWSIKWFLLLILIRPVADIFYFLKDVSIFLSPPIWLAVLTPFCGFLSLAFGKKEGERTGLSYIDAIILIWGGIVTINGFNLYSELDFIAASDVFLRSTIPFFIYLYARVFIRSMQHLYFILLTALFAALIPAIMFMLELIIGPFGTQITRGNIVRYHGLYADVFHYSIYSMFVFIIGGFLYLGPGKSKGGTLLSGKIYIGMVFFILVVLLQVAHITTFITFLALLVLFIYLNKEVNFLKVSLVAFTVGIMVIVLFSDDIERVVGPMLDREIGVLKGERRIELLGHGRLGRIIDYQEVWDRQPAYAKVFGMSFSYVQDKEDWFGGAIHNEYLRSLYTGGLFGIFGFILLLLIALWKSRRFPAPERFLFYSLSIMVVLYSFSMLPMLYYNLLYLFMPAMAYLSHTSSITKRELRNALK